MQKHQIGIIAVLIGIVVLAVIYGILAFGGDDKKLPADRLSSDASSRLPSIPNEDKKEVTSRLDQVKEKEKLEHEEERKSASETPINLDIFDVAPEEEKKPEHLDKTKHTVKKAIHKPALKKPETTQAPAYAEAPINKKENVELDPDLAFASRAFTTTEVSKQSAENPLANPASFRVKAVVHDMVTVTEGTRITIRTTETIFYKGRTLPSNTFLTATVAFNNNRVTLTIPPIPCEDGFIINEKLNAYDGNDLVKGLYAKELTENNAANQTASELVDEVNSEIPSGVARSVVRSFGKGKIKEQSVTLRSNHPIIIKP